MIKITGLDALQRELKEAQAALSNFDEQIGSVSFDPSDPASIDAAIIKMETMIDERVGRYSSNALVASLADRMKESFRQGIIEKAEAARLQGDR